MGSQKKFAYAGQFGSDLDLPGFSGARRWYLIASMQRCGSHLLGHALSETKELGVPLEYLNRGNLSGWRQRFGDVEWPELLDRIAEHRTSATGWFGMKAHWPQFEPHISANTFEALGDLRAVIFIWRRDLLDQAISFERAMQTGQWISGTESSVNAVFDYKKIVRRAQTIRMGNESWRSYIEHLRSRVPCLFLVYEDLITSPDRKLEEIADFFSLSAGAALRFSPRTRKQASGENELWREQFIGQMRGKHKWIIEEQDWQI